MSDEANGVTEAADALAAFAAGTGFDDLPPALVAAAKIVILDGLANQAAGSVQPAAVVLQDWASGKSGRPDSTVVGAAERIPSADAAFLNGFYGHCLDYEVQGVPSAHGTSSILPAALAVGERNRVSGRDLITAFVIGWDVQQRIRQAGERSKSMRVFHPPGVVGPLGAVAATGRLLGLDPGRMSVAFGLAASRSGGLFGNNGTMAKALHPAGAARSGVECADLAAAGMTANRDIFGDPRGLVRAFFPPAGGQPVFRPDALVDGLGRRFHLLDPGFNIKPYPAEIYMQWPIAAAREIRSSWPDLDPDDIESVVVEPPVFREDLSREKPESGLDGKFSYEYCVTVALTQPEVVINSFSDDVCFSPAVRSLLPAIRLVENPLIPSDKTTTWSTVTVTTLDGRSVSRTCRAFPGSVGNPMTDDARLAKVADCLSEGGFGDRTDAVVDLVGHLEEVDDVGEVLHPLTRRGCR